MSSLSEDARTLCAGTRWTLHTASLCENGVAWYCASSNYYCFLAAVPGWKRDATYWLGLSHAEYAAARAAEAELQRAGSVVVVPRIGTRKPGRGHLRLVK